MTYSLVSKCCNLTTINESVFEIDASTVEISNPRWEKGLKKLVEKVADGLDFTGKVDAKLKTLLVNKQGGDLHLQVDNDQQNMFATLIIQFPSFYKGNTCI